jgi:hypothetical protein
MTYRNPSIILINVLFDTEWYISICFLSCIVVKIYHKAINMLVEWASNHVYSHG